MRMPNAELAVVPEAKILRYLLDDQHPKGRTKATFFLSLGFTHEDWKSLVDALLLHAIQHDAIPERRGDELGTNYVVVGTMTCPDGRTTIVRSIWTIDDGDTIARSTTAYPAKGRKA